MTVTDDKNLGGAGDHVYANLTKNRAFGGGHVDVAGADDLVYRRYACRAIGQSGNGLQVSRDNSGSSTKVNVYDISTNEDYTISVWINCPSASSFYWAECAYKLGDWNASNFDTDSGSWTMIQKFEGGGPNGNKMVGTVSYDVWNGQMRKQYEDDAV